MSPDTAPRSPRSLLKILPWLIAGPLLVAALFLVGPFTAFRGDPAELAQRGSEIEAEFGRLLQQAADVTARALSEGSAAAFGDPPRSLSRRLEGTGVVDSAGQLLEWNGAPADPGSWLLDADASAWILRHDGVRTRLLVRSTATTDGRSSWSSFVIDTRLADLTFARLLPGRLTDGIELRLDVHSVPPDSRELDDLTHVVPLTSPDGATLGAVRLRAPMAPPHRTQDRASALAWATFTLVLLLGLLLDWPRQTDRRSGAVVAVVTVVASRLALQAVRFPAYLPWPDLGSARHYGSSSLAGMFSSPADLLLSAIAVWLVALVLEKRLLAELRSTLGCWFASAAAGLATSGLAFWLAVSLARNARAPLLGQGMPWNSWVRLTLTVGLLLVLLTAARFAGRLMRPAASTRLFWLAWPLAFVILALACGSLLQSLDRRLALERLSSELAPQILEQSTRRSIALRAALRHVDEIYRDERRAEALDAIPAEYLAYHFWVTGELFHSGYKSSIDLYTQAGPVSHFGFDLPPLVEPIDVDAEAQPEVRIHEESWISPNGTERALLHAEMPIRRDGKLLGTVVAHVLDEVDNLPFLPASQHFLNGMGPAPPARVDETFENGPHYVLYDSFGEMQMTTLDEAPAMRREFRVAAESGEPIAVHTEEESYVGLALEQAGWTHLLLVGDRGAIERAGASLRLTLLGLGILVAVSLLPALFRRGGFRATLNSLRGSFHRKLLLALLVASVLPLVTLVSFLRGYVEARGETELHESATQVIRSTQRILEDYASLRTDSDTAASIPDDNILLWLGGVVDHDIHLFQNGVLRSSSTRELFASGLLPTRLDGRTHRRLVDEGLPSLLRVENIGPNKISVAYAPVRSDDPHQELVVAVPLPLEQRRVAREGHRVIELILLTTVLLLGLLAITAAWIARAVARPVRELVGATARIAAGDYSTRLVARTHDEISELVGGFNTMASALATQRTDLERRRDYIERLLQHATTGVVSTDRDGRLVTLNPAARELLAAHGVEPDEGDVLIERLKRSTRLRPLAETLELPNSGASTPREIDLLDEDSPRRLRVVRIELPDPAGGRVGTLILIDDVTDLMRSNQLAAWAEMARAIAHEIKNPLTPIQLSTEHLERILTDRGVLPSQEVSICLENVIKQVRTLYEIAEEFSVYAKLPVLALTPQDPVTFVREAIAPYRSLSERGIELDERYEPSAAVAIDQRVLTRAIVNLVENALQAMPDGGKLTVSVVCEGRSVVVSIGDDGVGLEAEVRRRLFEPYFSTKSSGTGLGLAITQRAVEAHRGTIEVDSRLGEGTTFRIRLPLHEDTN